MVIRQSGLFLSPWYLSQHPAAEDGVPHFCQTGWRAGARPNPYFDPAWYIARNPDIAGAGVNPLLHYIAFGEAEGRDPCPYFFVRWYRETYGLAPKTPCLRHFMERRFTGQVNPVPVFDAAYYLENNPDVAAGGADPFEHFLVFGVAEARNPAAEFDIKFYLNRYGPQIGNENPLLHYIANRDSGMFLPSRPEHEGLVPSAVKRATRPSAHFEEFRPVPVHAPRRAKLIAFYLPQFHQVPENDAWWGKGFTDWANLGRALPRFVGHLQPRIPRDLGYYSLDDPNTLRRQVEMAKGAGLHGFVFYTYWFNRHRLLEKPLEQLLTEKTLDFPFCVMWANENWTRRWDGLEREVLIAQEYLESDDAALIAYFAGIFADPRYIRVQGRPLWMIYRVTLIPDATARIEKWRAMFREFHNEDPVIIMAQSLGDEYDPEPFGLDGAVEFPPHKLSQQTARLNGTLDLLDPDFSATVHDYQEIAETSLAIEEPDYPLIKTIVPGWDNDPRREGKGLVLHDATPDKYQDWLEKLVHHAARKPFFGEKLIAVNAWNEWAEGAFLEPDVHFGAAFLNATGRAICARDMADFAGGILLVGHDAQPHGAQLLLLHIARKLKRQWGIEVHLLLLGVGPLLGPYYETAQVSVAYDRTIIGNLLDKYRAMGIRTAIVNSAASARVVPWAEKRGIHATLLVHEMPQLLKEYNLEIQARLGGAAASNLVFSSKYLREKFSAAVDLKSANAVILAQGNYQEMAFDAQARTRIRAELGIADHEFMILGAGFAHIRKGFDLFIQLARKALAARNDVHFVWAGDIQFVLKTYLGPEMEQVKATGRFHHFPFTDHVADYFAAADVFALTSREDPYPTVVMEALACGVPCVAFEESGGIPELLRREKAGRVAKLADVEDFLAQLSALLDHDKLTRQRPRLSALAAQKFDFSDYVARLLRLAQPALRTVSVAVLNYNYARYLPARLESVFAQTYPLAEILLLDDASTDDSLSVAGAAAAAAKRDMRVIANAKNAGSVFAQWRRAAQAATGECIWLCEADDLADPTLVARLVEAMAGAENPLLAFSDSRAVDGEGKQVMPSYQSYYFDSGVKSLSRSGTWEATEFAQAMLAVRNLIPNVSAVLWRREALLRALDAVPDIETWRLAGDWRLYLALLTGEAGSVVYIAEPLNTHRRHESGVTQSLDADAHVREIAAMHAAAAAALTLDEATLAAQTAYLGKVDVQLRKKGRSSFLKKRTKKLL
jgi:glycosyltransferase involved in cell wall biosynthesis